MALLSMWCPVVAAEQEAPGGVPAAPAGPAFIRLAPISVPVIKDNRVAAQVDIALALELVEGKTADDLEPKRRQLQDAFISDVYAIFQQRPDASRPMDGAIVKERLRRTADRVLEPGLVKDVLIIQLFQQPRH